MVFIYILKLSNNKYYIGKTNNPKFRLKTHFDSNGSAWTKKYKPVKIEKIIPKCDDYDEDKYTLKYMEKYGIDNVRGGSFCQIKLSDDNQKMIEKMINSSTDKCFICGKKGHYASKCNNKMWNSSSSLKKLLIKECKEITDDENISGKDMVAVFNKLNINTQLTNIYGLCQSINELIDELEDNNELNYIIDYRENINYNDFINGFIHIVKSTDSDEEYECYSCNYCGKEFDTNKGATYHENIHCKSKKKKYECYSCNYCGKEFDTKKGATYHENIHCKSKKKKYECYSCNYCGRFGHFASSCYSKNIDL